MGRKILNFLEDEELAENVRRYPCLYNKSSIDYRDKRVRKNAWRNVEETMGMEEGN